MSDTDHLQPAIADVPDDEPTPNAYISSAAAVANLSTRYGLTITEPGYGNVLAASMAVDEEGPFMGVKIDPTQERSWPRTFKYGWPNIVAAPSPVLVATEYSGAWYLDYEGVVPQQVVDWVCLELWRDQNLPFDREVAKETASGSSVTYTGGPGEKGGRFARIDLLQARLLSPFLMRSGHTSPFLNYSPPS